MTNHRGIIMIAQLNYITIRDRNITLIRRPVNMFIGVRSIILSYRLRITRRRNLKRKRKRKIRKTRYVIFSHDGAFLKKRNFWITSQSFVKTSFILKSETLYKVSKALAKIPSFLLSFFCFVTKHLEFVNCNSIFVCGINCKDFFICHIQDKLFFIYIYVITKIMNGSFDNKKTRLTYR